MKRTTSVASTTTTAAQSGNRKAAAPAPASAAGKTVPGAAAATTGHARSQQSQTAATATVTGPGPRPVSRRSVSVHAASSSSSCGSAAASVVPLSSAPPVSFLVNGRAQQCAVRSTLLIDYLHALPTSTSQAGGTGSDHGGAGLQGTKLGCGQGGCGACTVNIVDDSGNAVAVNSCLKPVGLLQGKKVVTIEGLPPFPAPSSGKAAGAAPKAHCTSSCLSCPHSKDDDCASKVAAAKAAKGAVASSAACASAARPAAHTCKGAKAEAAASTLDPRVTLAQYNGSQCGFCSPGMVMSMNPFVGAGKSEQDIEDLFGGHICRCTGYRSILCGFKTYAPTGNATELLETPPYIMDENVGYGNGAVRHKNVTVVNVPIQPPPPQPQPVFKTTMLGSAAERPPPPLPVIAPDAPMHTWYMPAPLSLVQLQTALARGAYGHNYKLVVGNTSYGVYPEYEWAGVQTFVDISGVAELNAGIVLNPVSQLPEDVQKLDVYAHLHAAPASASASGCASSSSASASAAAAPKSQGSGALSPPDLRYFLRIGANTTIQGLIDYLSGGSAAQAGAAVVAQAMVMHLKRIAGRQVRNAGSIAGSLCMSRYWNFPGDTWVVLEGMQASVQVSLPTNQTTVSLEMWQLRQLNEPFLINYIFLPLWLDPAPNSNAFFASARVAQRLQNAHPLINGAFFFNSARTPEQSLTAVWGNITAANCPSNSVAPNGRGPPTQAGTAHYRLSAQLCTLVFTAWQRGWTGSYTLDAVLNAVRTELVSAAKDTEAEQGDIQLRCDIATNLLLKFCINSLGAPATPADAQSVRQSIYQIRTATPSAGSQKFLVNTAEEPVSEPIIKSSALGQTSGKANYTQSVMPPGCRHATFVTSWAAVGAIQPFPSSDSAIAGVLQWLQTTYGITQVASDFNLYTPQNSKTLQLTNLQNDSAWMFGSKGSGGGTYQQFPTYLVANVEVVYAGQPVAILVGPSERVVTLAAEWLGLQSTGFLRLAPGMQRAPILSVADSKNRESIIVNQNANQSVPTKLNITSPSLPPEIATKAIYSVSRDANGPNNLTSVDFAPYANDRYVIVKGTHSVPPQVHFYMETQSAVALAPTSVPPSYTQMPLAPASRAALKLELEADPLTVASRPDLQEEEKKKQEDKKKQDEKDAAAAAKDAKKSSKDKDAASKDDAPKVKETVNKYMTIYSSTQSCMSIQGSTQRLLNTCHKDANWSVSLLTPQLGGGFGGKEPQSSFTALGAAFCASELGQDVRFVLSRDADMRIIGHRHPMDAAFTVAADRSTGRIAAMEIVLDADAGCTYDATLPVVDLAILTSENAYMIDVFCARVDSWFTNKASSTAMRSFGVVQSLQVTEYAIERLCEHLTHLSPFLIRSANFFPYRDQAGTFPITPYGQEVKFANLDGVWSDMDDMMLSMANLRVFDGVRERVAQEQQANAKANQMLLTQEQVQARSTADASAKPRVPVAATGIGFDHITSLVNAFNAGSTHQKMGLSVLPLKYGISFTSIKMNVGGCVIQIAENGQVVLQCPGVEMGQGLDTKMKQIAALKLTLWSKWITYDPSGVQTKFFTSPQPQPQKDYLLPGTGASTGSDLNGGAITIACNLLNAWIAQQLANTAVWAAYVQQGQRWFVPAVYSPTGVLLRAQSDLWPQAAAILTSFNALPKQTAPAFYYSPDLVQVTTEVGKPHVGSPFYYFNYAAAAVLCLIDCLTGEFTILQSDVIYDAGISLNPAIDIGQVEGGFVMGLGYATTEEVTYNSDGVLTSLNTWLYKPPSTLEIPHQFNVRLYPLQSQISQWKDEERKHAGEDALAPVFDRIAQAHPNNPLRKGWLRIDALDQVIDPYGVQSSKTTGEPPLVLANTVYFAIRQAVRAALNQPTYGVAAAAAAAVPVGDVRDVVLTSPATTLNIRQAILSNGMPRRHVLADRVRPVVGAMGPSIGPPRPASRRNSASGSSSSSAAAAAAAAASTPKSISVRAAQVSPMLPSAVTAATGAGAASSSKVAAGRKTPTLTASATAAAADKSSASSKGTKTSGSASAAAATAATVAPVRRSSRSAKSTDGQEVAASASRSAL